MSPERASRRTLVGEILFAQVAYAALLGLAALVSVWSISKWVVEDNLESWSARWIAELDSLGAGFYLEDEWHAAYEVVCERLHAEWEAHRSGDTDAIERAADYLVRVSRGKFIDERQRH